MLKHALKAGAVAATILVAGQAGAATLTTTFAHNNGFAGNMFDVSVGGNSLLLTDIALNVDSGTTGASIYWKTGSYVGSETDAGAWTLLDTASLTSAGAGNPTSWDIADLFLGAGGSYAFYIALDESFMNYTNGTGAGNVAASNGDLTIFEGIGYGDVQFGGSIFSPRIWNGTMTYSVAAVPVPATLPLLLGALGLAGVVARRRKAA